MFDFRIDAMTKPTIFPRFANHRLDEALEDTPVVLVHGPRQCGKTTLARMFGDVAGYEYITFDDDVQLAAAQTDPVGFVADLTDKTILDEVQRVPALFLSLKSAVDRDRRPGRFILTGYFCWNSCHPGTATDCADLSRRPSCILEIPVLPRPCSVWTPNFF